jgi:hypothetical protein
MVNGDVMAIQFCVVRDTISNKYLCHKEEVWGHGSTMTGPMTETVFELERLDNLFGTYTSDHFTMFENEDAAKSWINSSYGGKKFIERQRSEINFEVVTFADLDAIVEQELLDVGKV